MISQNVMVKPQLQNEEFDDESEHLLNQNVCVKPSQLFNLDKAHYGDLDEPLPDAVDPCVNLVESSAQKDLASNKVYAANSDLVQEHVELDIQLPVDDASESNKPTFISPRSSQQTRVHLCNDDTSNDVIKIESNNDTSTGEMGMSAVSTSLKPPETLDSSDNFNKLALDVDILQDLKRQSSVRLTRKQSSMIINSSVGGFEEEVVQNFISSTPESKQEEKRSVQSHRFASPLKNRIDRPRPTGPSVESLGNRTPLKLNLNPSLLVSGRASSKNVWSSLGSPFPGPSTPSPDSYNRSESKTEDVKVDIVPTLEKTVIADKALYDRKFSVSEGETKLGGTADDFFATPMEKKSSYVLLDSLDASLGAMKDEEKIPIASSSAGLPRPTSKTKLSQNTAQPSKIQKLSINTVDQNPSDGPPSRHAQYTLIGSRPDGDIESSVEGYLKNAGETSVGDSVGNITRQPASSGVRTMSPTHRFTSPMNARRNRGDTLDTFTGPSVQHVSGGKKTPLRVRSDLFAIGRAPDDVDSLSSVIEAFDDQRRPPPASTSVRRQSGQQRDPQV